jgi:hypothetical protein
MQASSGSMTSLIQERASTNQRLPRIHHMDPMTHQSDQNASNTRVHRESTSGPTKQPLREAQAEEAHLGVGRPQDRPN